MTGSVEFPHLHQSNNYTSNNNNNNNNINVIMNDNSNTTGKTKIRYLSTNFDKVYINSN